MPGRSRVIHVPGHTAASAAFIFEDSGLLFTGNALVTVDTAIRRVGPRVLCRAFTEDRLQALLSLNRPAEEEAEFVLLGHGHPWTGGSAEAVRLALLPARCERLRAQRSAAGRGCPLCKAVPLRVWHLVAFNQVADLPYRALSITRCESPKVAGHNRA